MGSTRKPRRGTSSLTVYLSQIARYGEVIVGMERERKMDGKSGKIESLLFCHQTNFLNQIFSSRELTKWFERKRGVCLPPPIISWVSTSFAVCTSVNYDAFHRCPMFHGDKSATASKCFVPLGALFSPLGSRQPIPARRYRTRGCRCITNSARRI